MLPLRKHWHNAPEQAPHREARLLAFANANTPATPAPDPTDPTQSATYVAAAGRNPDGTPIAPAAAPAQAPSPVTAPGGVVDQTRSAVAGALQPAGSAEQAPESLNAKEIAEALKTMRTDLGTIRELRRGRKDVGEYLRNLPDEEEHMVDEAVHALDAQWETLVDLEYRAAQLSEWKAGNTTPKDFRRNLKNAYKNDPRQTALLMAFDRELMDPSISELARKWDQGRLEQESDKQLVIHQIWKAIDGDALLRELQEYREVWEGCVKEVDTVFKEAAKPGDELAQKKENEKNNANPEEGVGIWQSITNIRRNGILGIGLYTPSEYITAFQKVWQAFQDAKKERHDQQANKLAAVMGNTIQGAHLPYGEQINRRLGSTLESEFNKAKNEYKEELGDDNFEALVGKFQQVKDDPPKAIAVLEAAAGHGWLYDIADFEEEKSLDAVEIFGVKYLSVVPDHWDEAQRGNYLSTLIRSNNSGQKEERGKGADRVREQTKPEVFKKRFEAALNAQNYWSAIGIAETFIDRGKLGEVSEYLTLTFLEHLRTNESARRYMTRPVLEQFGIMGNKWGTANFATTNIVFHVDTVYNLKQKPDEMKGPFLSIIEQLQNDVTAAAGGKDNIDRSKVIDYSSQLLAGKTVTINGKALSIFNDKYREYWDEKKNPVFGTFEGKQALGTAPDYYQTDASILLLPKVSIVAILKTGSTGTFDSPEFAMNLAGQAILRVEELEKKNPAAAEVFRQEMGRKLKAGFKLAFTGQAPKQLGKYPWKRGNQEGKAGKKEGQEDEEGSPMIADLIAHGFMTYKDVTSYSRGHQGDKEFAEELRKQLNALGINVDAEPTAGSGAGQNPPAAGASARPVQQAA